MINLYIAYSSKDSRFVSEVVQNLENSGIFTYFAAVDVRPGIDLLDWMNTNLRRSTHIILFWSKHAAESKWVKQEWETAFWESVKNDKKTIIPVRLDNTDLPPLLDKIKYLNSSDGLNMVIDSIKLACLPEVDFSSLRRSRLLELSGYEYASSQMATERANFIKHNASNIKISIFDFYYPAEKEKAFLALLRSSGIQAILPLERKGTVDGIIRVTGHLRATQVIFDHMDKILTKNNYRVEKQN
ncbi:toll/interleukin-1 receptor domain-containing protein [Chloroflexota bacterium]